MIGQTAETESLFEEGRDSLTRYQVVKREEKTTVVRLIPITGRSHQLRVHMQSLGHPIVGDDLYAPQEAVEFADRLQLHAAELCSTIHVVIGCALYLSLVTSIPKPRSRFCSISILSENYRTIKSYPKTNLIVGSG